MKPGFQRPVVIHRAIMGSIERFTAIICEETGGKFPFWISPRQLVICTINDQCIEFAQKVANRLMLEGYHCQVDSSSLTIQKKIRNATLKHFNFIASVGMEEVKNEYLDIRDANSGDRVRRIFFYRQKKLAEVHFFRSFCVWGEGKSADEQGCI